MYKEDILKVYIKNSELRVFSNNIKIRLSKELANKYDLGTYNKYLENLQKCYDQINSLNIEYPGNANPTLYIYIVPDDNYTDLLKIPSVFDKGLGGGKPVKCYDLDGFNSAYGLTQNILEEYEEKKQTISRTQNEIHELAHLVHSQFFFSANRFICEGFAEALSLYTLDYENIFLEHRNIIKSLEKEQILSAKELLDSEKNESYGTKSVLPNKSCSFRYSYISSYLFVRGCIETLEEKHNLTKIKATEKFLEIVKNSKCTNEWLIFDIANEIGISKEQLLTEKKMQLNIIETL